MPHPRATQPIPTGKEKLPWKFPIPADARHLHNGRKVKYFAKRGECLQFISTLRRQLTEHTAAFNQLPDAIKAQLTEAYQTLEPFPNATPIPELARREAERLNVAARSKLLSPIIEEMYLEKKADGARPNYLRSIRGSCKVFARQHSERLASSFTGPELAKWLRESYPNANSRDSYRRNLGVLFSFAKEKGYVNTNPIAETKAVNARREDEVPILTPEQLATLFRVALPRLRPYLAFCAFAALRPEECRRLLWEHIRSDAIYVPKAVTKTVARRVPIVPTLAAWIEHFGEQTGGVSSPHMTWRRDFRAATKAAGWEPGTWSQDALRHSAISYWLGATPDRASVAKWSGNSEGIQTAHYDNPRSPEEAAAWYGILPTPENTPANVIEFHHKGRGKGRPRPSGTR